MAKDFLTLNLNRIKKGDLVEGIEESMSSLGVSGRDFTLPCFNDPQSEIYSDKMTLLHEGFGDIQLSYLNQNNAGSMFPIFTSPARSGSISSGQPVIQNNTQKTSTHKDDKLSSTRASSQTSFIREQSNTAEESQLASKISMSYSSSSLTFEGEPSTSRSTTVAKQTEYLSQNLQTPHPHASTSTKSVLTSEANNTPFIFSTNTVSQVVSTPQTKSVPVTTSSMKGLPFKLPVNTNAQGSSLSPPRYFGSSVSQTPSFTSVVTSSTPPSSSFTLSSTFDPANSNSIHSSNTTPLNPLASLNSLVSGMDPSKPFSQKTTPIKEPAVSNNMSTPPQAALGQPFVFKFPNASENKVEKEEGTTSLKTNVPSLPFVKKQELPESENAMSVQSKFGGAFNNLSFGSGSPQKSIFGNMSPSTPPKAVISPNTQTNKSDQTPRNMLSQQKTHISAFNVTTFASPTQKTFFGETTSSTISSDAPKPLEKLAETLNTTDNPIDGSTSTVIEVSLSPSKSLDDTKTCLEKLSAATNVTITKIDPAEKKTVEQTKPEADSNSSSLFSSFSLSSPSTTTKLTPSIFGGSSPTKPSVTYETAQPGPQSSEAEQKEGNKLETIEKRQESPKPQSLFGDGSLTTKPTTSFSFSVSTLQSSLTSTDNAQPINSGLSFGVELPTPSSTSASSTDVSSEPKSSTFSFAQAITTTSTTTQPSSTAFSFAQAITTSNTTSQPSGTAFSFAQATATTNTTTQPSSTAFTFAITTAPSTASSAFGFGNLAPFAENKPKSEFSFGQQAQPLASTPSSVFSGFSSKPTDTSTIFGGSTATTGENKNAFGQVVSSSAENKSIFGQPLSTEPDAQKGFSFSLSSSTTTVQSSVFGSPATTAASFFGQPICSPTSTTSTPFGQPTSTSSVFGSVTSSPFGGTSGFGSKPTFGQSGGSFFGQTRYEICIHNSFKLKVFLPQITTVLKITFNCLGLEG